MPVVLCIPIPPLLNGSTILLALLLLFKTTLLVEDIGNDEDEFEDKFEPKLVEEDEKELGRLLPTLTPLFDAGVEGVPPINENPEAPFPFPMVLFVVVLPCF